MTTGSGSAAVSSSNVTSPLEAITNRSASLNVTSNDLDYTGGIGLQEAAAAADAVVMVISVEAGESDDRADLSLNYSENLNIATLAAANPRTVVVLDGPGALLMPWLDAVSAVLVGWYPGEANGNALASVLFGDVSPSGKLPITFPADATTLPGLSSDASIDYTEGLNIGYRELDSSGLEPLFEFGFGLSYTTFSYSTLKLGPGSDDGSVDVSFILTNTGERTGADVSQVYLSFPEAAGEPPRVLRGFERTELAPGESRMVHIELPARAFSCWDPVGHARYAPSGTYTVSVGSSSRQLPLVASFNVIGLPKSPPGPASGSAGSSGVAGAGSDPVFDCGDQGLQCDMYRSMCVGISDLTQGTTTWQCSDTCSSHDCGCVTGGGPSTGFADYYPINGINDENCSCHITNGNVTETCGYHEQ